MHHLLAAAWCFFTISALLGPVLSVRAQMIPSGKLIENGIKEHDAGNYKKALEFYRQVPDGDTNYALAVYETTLSYLADSAYRDAKQTAFHGLELEDADRRGFLLNIAHAYDYLGMQDSAIFYYDSLARMNPTDNQPWFEKGVLYGQKEMYDTAIGMYRKSLMINPYHFRSHLGLGTAYLMQGRLTESFIALEMSLLMTTNARMAGQAIQLLGMLASQKEDVIRYYRQKKNGYSHPVFDETDRIMNARLVLDKGYKLKSALSDEQIVRVAHMIMEQVPYDKNDTSFVMQYYVPLLQEISRHSMFDEYMLLLFSGYEIKVVEQLLKSRKYNLEETRQVVFPYYNKLFSTRKLNYEARKTAPAKYLMQSSEGLILSGNLNAKGEPGEGMTRLYQNHYLIAEGKYDKNNKKQGVWRYYTQYGRLRSEEQYEDGKMAGTARSLYRHGLLKSEDTYNKQGEVIAEKRYGYDGRLKWESVKGQNGIWKKTFYYKSGAKEMVLPVKDDKVLDGGYKIWYESGALHKEISLADGELDGVYKEYFENGTPSYEITYTKGKLNGPYRSFHENGKPELNCNYEEDRLSGPYEKYDGEGLPVNKCVYKNGKMDGTDYWYHKGREYGRVGYRNGTPVSSLFTDPGGNVVSEHKGGQKINVLQIFDPNGTRFREIPIRNGEINGEASFYFATGKLRESAHFEKDIRSGKAVEYFPNGKVSTESFYKEGRRNGLYKSFFRNGQIQATGYLINSEKEGIWNYYTPDGIKVQESFYIEDEKNGTVHYYYEGGKPDYSELLDMDLIRGVIQYDSGGKVWRKQIYSWNDKSYQLLYPGGKAPRFESEMSSGLLHGTFKKWYPDGKLMEQGHYKFGKRDSSFVTYYYNGGVQISGSYKSGNRHGLWKFMDEEGRTTREINYRNGEREGTDKTYVNGILRSEYHYHKGNCSGDQLVYGDPGVLALALRFTDDLLTGYSYAGKDGQLLPFIPVKGGTAEVRAFYPDGTPSAIFRYKDNGFDGTQLLYYKNGKPAEERNIKGGDYNGPYKRYYSDGKLMYEAEYKDDNLTGTENYYDAGGKLIRSKKYSGGYLHGTVTVEDKSGKRLPVDYYYGVPVHIGIK